MITVLLIHASLCCRKRPPICRCCRWFSQVWSACVIIVNVEPVFLDLEGGSQKAPLVVLLVVVVIVSAVRVQKCLKFS